MALSAGRADLPEEGDDAALPPLAQQLLDRGSAPTVTAGAGKQLWTKRRSGGDVACYPGAVKSGKCLAATAGTCLPHQTPHWLPYHQHKQFCADLTMQLPLRLTGVRDGAISIKRLPEAPLPLLRAGEHGDFLNSGHRLTERRAQQRLTLHLIKNRDN